MSIGPTLLFDEVTLFLRLLDQPLRSEEGRWTRTREGRTWPLLFVAEEEGEPIGRHAVTLLERGLQQPVAESSDFELPLLAVPPT